MDKVIENGVIYQDIETGKLYRISRSRVMVWNYREDGWRRVNHIIPADLAHYPYVGIRVEIYPNEDK